LDPPVSSARTPISLGGDLDPPTPQLVTPTAGVGGVGGLKARRCTPPHKAKSKVRELEVGSLSAGDVTCFLVLGGPLSARVGAMVGCRRPMSHDLQAARRKS
jgi:hypothetical protein